MGCPFSIPSRNTPHFLLKIHPHHHICAKNTPFLHKLTLPGSHLCQKYPFPAQTHSLKTFPSRKSCLFLLILSNQPILSRIKSQILPEIHFLPISGTKISIFQLIFMEWLPFFHFGYPQPSIHRQDLKNSLRYG